MMNLKTILNELSQSSESILATSVLSQNGVTLSNDADATDSLLEDGSYAFPLVAATASYGQKLSNAAMDGDLDWMLLTNGESQLLIGQSGPNQYLCCLLALDSEIESIVQDFKLATDRIKTL